MNQDHVKTQLNIDFNLKRNFSNVENFGSQNHNQKKFLMLKPKKRKFYNICGEIGYGVKKDDGTQK